MTLTRSVLIVDDDPFIRRLIATTLEDVAGFDVEEAGDGVEAVAAARSLGPAIVFLDIDMPRMNGIEACRRLRELEGGDTPTIVMLTAAGPDAEPDARAAGADLFLTKPFSPLDLLELVDALGRTDGRARPSTDRDRLA
jgi:CheY-like chemotaxis protein